MSCRWPECDNDAVESCPLCRRTLCWDHRYDCEWHHCLNPERGIDFRDDEDLCHLLGYAQDALAKIARHPGDRVAIEEHIDNYRERAMSLMLRFRQDFERTLDRKIAAQARAL